VDWMRLSRDRDQWWALVNWVMSVKLTEHYAIKTYWWTGGIAPLIL
jgi:hypothetical protein